MRRIAVLASLSLMLVALAVAGCRAAKLPASRGEETGDGLPFVSKVEKAGGPLAVTHVGGRKLVVTDGGLVGVSGGRASIEHALPEDTRVQPETVVGRFALMRETDGEPVVWDLEHPGEPVTRLSIGKDRVSSMLSVDVVGSPVPEAVLVMNHQWRETGSPRDYHERVEVWSLEGAEPSLIASADLVAEGRVSLISAVYAVDAGLGDRRPELLWTQQDATNNEDGDSRLVVMSPSEGFRVRESERFSRWLFIDGVAQDDGPTRLHLSPSIGEDRKGTVMEVREGVAVPVADSSGPFTQPVKSAEPAYPSPPDLPEQYREGIDGRLLVRDYGSPVEITLPGGQKMTPRPRKPITSFRDFGLADLDGDGADELVAIADGEPNLCSDTYTGYVGWAEPRKDGSFGPIRWSEPLGGGLAGIAIADIDGEPGEEIVAGIYDTFCGGRPVGLWIFSPGEGR